MLNEGIPQGERSWPASAQPMDEVGHVIFLDPNWPAPEATASALRSSASRYARVNGPYRFSSELTRSVHEAPYRSLSPRAPNESESPSSGSCSGLPSFVARENDGRTSPSSTPWIRLNPLS